MSKGGRREFVSTGVMLKRTRGRYPVRDMILRPIKVTSHVPEPNPVVRTLKSRPWRKKFRNCPYSHPSLILRHVTIDVGTVMITV